MMTLSFFFIFNVDLILALLFRGDIARGTEARTGTECYKALRASSSLSLQMNQDSIHYAEDDWDPSQFKFIDEAGNIVTVMPFGDEM